MKHNTFAASLLCLVLVVLLAAAALTLTGCAAAPGTSPNAQSDQAEPIKVVGEGAASFAFDVAFADGTTVHHYTVRTDAETVGEALTELQLIDGTPSEYGLYVTTVDGETLDWNTDGMYWAFYENGEYAMTGVDSTPVTDGAAYAFVATAG